MTKDDAEKIKREIDDGYHNQKESGYPPFALTAWEDRSRYREYVFKVIDKYVVGELTPGRTRE